jgi:hypothetical protein
MTAVPLISIRLDPRAPFSSKRYEKDLRAGRAIDPVEASDGAHRSAPAKMMRNIQFS